MPPNPRNLILNLLLAADGQSLSASDAVAASELFGIRANSVRVALVRLAASGLVASAGRGSYRLGPQAAGLADDLARWRTSESRVCDWQGGWIMVSTGGLGRSDRSVLRTRHRALALLGFQALDEALYIRPDNLVGHASAIRERLYPLGLDAQAPVFAAHDLDAVRDKAARGLWQGKRLNKAYDDTRQRLQTWLDNAHTLELEVAARESYLLGNDAIRQLVFDPLLPEPLVDVAARQAFTHTVLAFDRAGHAIWQRVLPSLGTPSTQARAHTTNTP